MDYELKIKALEEDIRHWNTLKELHGGRLDANDRSIAAIHEIISRVELQLERNAIQQGETDRMLKDLIAALTASRPNGKH